MEPMFINESEQECIALRKGREWAYFEARPMKKFASSSRPMLRATIQFYRYENCPVRGAECKYTILFFL